eukprot:m51a1_g12945 putative d-alanine--d-alanine ligase (375) ;mRNA; f:1301-2983
MRVAVVYNTKDKAPQPQRKPGEAVPDDYQAEWDTWHTVQNYERFIRALGHEVVMLHGDDTLPGELRRLEAEGRRVDLCWNTCEGYRGAAREAQMPALLEMVGYPYSFGKPLCMALTLDKAMTKRVLAYHGIPTPRFIEMRTPEDPIDPAMQYPLFVKPNAEGTGMGITAKSLCRTEAEVREMVRHLLSSYAQSALVEEYIPGRDVTCGVVGNVRGDGSLDDLTVLPINEVDWAHTLIPDDLKATGELFYCRSVKAQTFETFTAVCPADLPEDVTLEIQRLTAETFRATQCLDGARVDFRLDTRGGKLRPIVLELNALPGMTEESDLTVCAVGAGWTHDELVQNIFDRCCRRYGLASGVHSPRPANYRVLFPKKN